MIYSERTNTIIGLPYYIAPEIINGQGYSSTVDFWAIAITAFEFLLGEVPFGEKLTDPLEIYKSILSE